MSPTINDCTKKVRWPIRVGSILHPERILTDGNTTQMLFDKNGDSRNFKYLKLKNLAPRARFELATLRLTAEMIKNLSALSGVAYKKIGAILPPLVSPNPAPKAS